MIRMPFDTALALETLLATILEDIELGRGQLRDSLPLLLRARAALRSQLDDYRNGSKGQMELVDRIAHLLKKRGPGNYLSGVVLDKMRRAILNPGELFKTEYRPQRLCPRCETPIHIGVVTCIGDDDENLFCMQCFKPSWCLCSICKEPVSISETVLKRISGATCTPCEERLKMGGGDPRITSTMLGGSDLPLASWVSSDPPTQTPATPTGVQARTVRARSRYHHYGPPTEDQQR